MPNQATRYRVKLFDMVLGLSRALDLLHPAIGDHHMRVAYIACCLAEELGLPDEDVQTVLIAGALHDVGTVSSSSRLHLLGEALRNYHIDEATLLENIHAHGFVGRGMLREFLPFDAAARAICFHHVEWNFGRGQEFTGEEVPLLSAILHLADRVAILPDPAGYVLAQARDIRERVALDSGKRFHPEVAAAFQTVSGKESFWLDIVNKHKEFTIHRRFGHSELELDLEALIKLSGIFGKIVDFFTPFTATHSLSVALVSEGLGAHLGFSVEQAKLLRIAGHLHDIGKLAVPPAILHKPDKLTPEELLVVKQHPYYTHQILSTVPGLETVNTWAALHHERLDGRGYPYQHTDVPLGSRIVAVADIFAAITEERPYRKGMEQARAIAVLDQMACENAIDGDVVAILRGNYDEIRHLVR
ncbi:hypothetical protein B9N43_10150 [Denitratisoma sp. DHT3]|uniref:HD-GYP domain-containing protein n=1 Tax=Denitratisoma sp. DHT3 TaxID=1981880 RepID=UPI00119833A3|nr:HD domain-containing phosphohydrolase [Denitratisoma sp. DHT3]QDX81578.1 hypothetical protein B9N43_10150 [Denitratisoma sp. DHT3]